MKNRMRQACVVLMGAMALAGLAANLHGQAATASLQGNVTDASGAAVPDARVQLKNVNTGAARTVTSNAQGRYNLTELSVGDYEVQASKTGFQTVVRRVTLNVGAEAVIDVSLQVGQQNQTVTVEGEASQVETTNATVGTLIGQQQMRELPLNGRNFEQLIVLTPGVQTIAGNAFQATGFQGRAPEYSVAGSRPTGQAILLDDENLQNFWSKGMGSVMGTSLGVEAIGEFQTLTNTYSAQFGGNGAVVNAVSRSGANSVHGSAYEFFRNDVLDSRGFFDPHTIPTYRQNQFGGSIGGPIKKDKIFFFTNYEGVRLAQGESKIAFVPGCNLPQFAASCVPPASDSAAVATAVRNTLAVFPAANLVVGGKPEALTVANRIGNEDYVLARFDWVISEKDAFFARYISDKSSFVEPYGGGGFAGGPIANWPEQDSSHTQFATAEWRRILSPTLVNVVRASFSRPGTYEFQNPTQPGGLVNGVDPLQFAPVSSGRPDGIVAIGGLSGIGSALQLPFNTTQNRYTEADDLTWTRGAHNVRIGASVSRLQSNTYMPFFDGGQFSFANLPQFLTGSPLVALYVPLGSYPNRDFRQIEISPYAQDDWKISSRFTVNLGLRYEFSTNPTDQHNQLFAVTNVATATAPYFTHVPNAMATNPTGKNFDPRVGIAYDPFGDHKTSIRAGFGFFRELISVNTFAPGYWTSPPWALSVTPNIPHFSPVTYPILPFNGLNLGSPSSTPGFDYNSNTTPYVMQYNFNIQREIAKGTVFNIGYVGSRGVHLMTQVQLNPPLACLALHCSSPSTAQGYSAFAAGGPGAYLGYPGTVNGAPGVVANGYLNPGLGQFFDLSPQAWSKYNSLQTNITRRLTQNIQGQFSYTWSKCMDDGGYLGSFNTFGTTGPTNPYNAKTDNGPCAYDINHILKANALYALPFKGNRLVSGWRASGIFSWNTGLPVNITDGYDQSTGGSLYAIAARPNLNPGFSNNPIIGTANEWYNPAAFSIEAPGTLGNLGRDTVRGPHIADLDFSLTKDTKISERINSQFRAEFFNILNHTNLGLPNNSLFVSTNGAPTGTAGQITSIVGTPRQIQFALKLIF
jgi:hypothetical protein